MTTFGLILVLITFIIFFALSIKLFKELFDFCTIHQIFFSPIHAFFAGLTTIFIFVVLASLSSSRFEPDLSTKKRWLYIQLI